MIHFMLKHIIISICFKLLALSQNAVGKMLIKHWFLVSLPPMLLQQDTKTTPT